MADHKITIAGSFSARVEDDRFIYTGPNGYVLWLVGADGGRKKLDESYSRDVNKPFIFDVPPGARLELDLK